MTIVEVKDLCKSFGGIKAVNHLNFTVNKRDIYGLLGINGSGKSTTLRMLLTLLKPDEGEIFILDKPLKKNPVTIKKRLGALIERPDFYDYLTAYKNLEILLKYSGINPGNNRIMEVLDIVGLKQSRNKKVGEFSQGMKQRLGIAQAMIHDPELIILDEPANGLDPHGLIDVRNLILSLNRDFGKTIILSSHILREVEMVANRMIVIHEGESIREGEVKKLLTEFDSKIRLLVSDTKKAAGLINAKYPDLKITDAEDGLLIRNIKESQVSELNRYLVEHGVNVSGLIPVKNLEEYFISLV